VSSLVSVGYEFAEGELEQTLNDKYASARRKYVEQVNDFLLKNRYIAELPADDGRWDEPAPGENNQHPPSPI
jgi:hypothetical protein